MFQVHSILIKICVTLKTNFNHRYVHRKSKVSFHKGLELPTLHVFSQFKIIGSLLQLIRAIVLITIM